MNEPERNHYIPQMLLREFTNKNGKLYCFRKDSPGGVFESNPKNAFVKKNLYTQQDAHGNKDFSVEKDFAKLEGQTGPIIKKIIGAARLGKPPCLTDSEKEIWDVFFCSQWIRVPKWHKDLQQSSLFSDAKTIFERDIRPLTDAEHKKFSRPEEQHRQVHNAWVTAVASSLDLEAFKILQTKGILIGVVRNPQRSFIIGDYPILRGPLHLSNPKAEALLPISYDVIVTPTFSRGEEKLVEVKEMDHIRFINKGIFEQSDMVAGRSRELIESLAGVRKKNV